MPRERFGSNMSSWFSLNDYHPFSYNDRVILCFTSRQIFWKKFDCPILVVEG